MFGANDASRSRTGRPSWNRSTTHGRGSERLITRAVKAVAESLERRMLLSATAAMVADINTITADAYVSSLADLGNGKVVFFANDGIHGEEPFVSDGTAAGTMLIKDINPGPGDSPQLNASTIASHRYQPGVVANGRFFFAANDGLDGYELWSTDGTPGGTMLIKDINPGSASSYPSQIMAIGNTVFFVANDGTNGWQLWDTAGTPAGTIMLSNIGASPSNIGAVFNGRLFFSANDGVDGSELWSTDGTLAGTSMVTTIGTSPTGASVGLDLVFDGRLYFTADDGVHGDELWSTDGTAAGTAMVMDINPGSGSSNPSALTICGSQLFFTANDGTDGTELWTTDGTSTGTHLVADLTPGSASSYQYDFTDVNGTLFFSLLNGDLYKSDGTSAGTVPLRSFNGPGGIGSIIQYGGRAYFIANDGVSGTELWQSDGTTAGTTQVADLAPGAASTSFYAMTVAGTNLFFAADVGEGQQLYVINSVGSAPTAISPAGSPQLSWYPDFQAVGSGLYFNGPSLTTAAELWHSDGTAAGTGIVANITTMTIGSNPSQVFEIDGHGVFTANDTMHGTEVWVTDGSSGGTTLLKDIVPGPADGLALSAIGAFVPARLGNYLYFAAGIGNGQLWRTDGTANGTTLCLSFMPASPYTGYAGVSQLTSINGSLYFFADDGTGSALYISDGSPNGTTRLQYLSPPIGNGIQATSSQFSVVGNEVIFAATDSAHGTEPWVTNGTSAGTKLLMDIDPGTASSLPNYFNGLERFAILGWFAYFTVHSQTGMSLWRTDGTSAGTSIVEDFSTNATVSGVDDLTPFNGKLYFVTTPKSGYGGDIWASDGTPSGTQLFESFPSNTGVGAPAALTVVGNTLFFSAAPSADASWPEIFASDGTLAGTTLVPGDGQAGVSAGNLTNVQGTLYFNALNDTGALDFWRLDQSPLGGMSIEDLCPAPASVIDASPTNLAGLDGTLFFQATDQAHGAELWKLNLLQANAGGPYLAAGDIHLDASGSRDPNPSYPLTYSWDLNGDGIFGGSAYETGVNPTFVGNQFYPGVYPVAVQVTGSWQNTATATSYVSVPPRPHFAGDTVIFTLGTTVTNASIQSWSINWGDGTPVENYAGNTTSVSHLFASASGANPFMVQVSAVGSVSTVQPLPMPVTIYADPVLNNGLLTLTGTGGDDIVTASSVGGEFDVGLNGALLKYNSSLISRFIYNDGGGDDQISLRDYVSATLNLSTGNDYITNAGQTAIVNAGTGKIRLDAFPGTNTTFAASSGSGIRQIQFSSINIDNTGTVLFANSSATLGDYSNHANRTLAIVDAGGLNIASGATLDIGDNSMLLKYLAANKSATDSMISSLVTSGYAGGAWSGTGITSSEANFDAFNGAAARTVGWADQQDVGVNSFEGDTTDVADGNEIMIKFTYYGDTDLDGSVASSDSSNFSTGVHLTGNAFWEFGDFDYSGGKPTASDSQLFSTGLAAYKTFGQL